MQKYKVAIIILNWNGWQDTIECLASLMNSTYQDFQMVVLDNGSTDDSLVQITNWAHGEIPVAYGPSPGEEKIDSVDCVEIAREALHDKSTFIEKTRAKKLVLIRNAENLGFAKGVNVGIRYAVEHDFEYTYLLNNDTTLEHNSLHHLIEFIDDGVNRNIVTPLITFYDDPSKVWYYGGTLTFTGRRKFYFANEPKAKIAMDDQRKISFISGCALFCRTAIFKKYGLLTEDFFFGEEDHEFSHRMKKNGVAMFALAKAEVYHKVSISNKKVFSEDRLPYKFIGYLNRFVHKKITMQHHVLLWKAWRSINLAYIVPKLIFLEKYEYKKIKKFATLLIKYSNKVSSVDRELFFEAQNLLK